MATGNNDAIAEAAKRAAGAGRMQSMAGTPGVEEKDRGAGTPEAGVRGALTAESMRVQAVTGEAGENLEAVRAEMSAWAEDVVALRTQIAGIRKRLQKLRAGLAPMAAEAGTLENQQVEIMAAAHGRVQTDRRCGPARRGQAGFQGRDGARLLAGRGGRHARGGRRREESNQGRYPAGGRRRAMDRAGGRCRARRLGVGCSWRWRAGAPGTGFLNREDGT